MIFTDNDIKNFFENGLGTKNYECVNIGFNIYKMGILEEETQARMILAMYVRNGVVIGVMSCNEFNNLSQETQENLAKRTDGRWGNRNSNPACFFDRDERGRWGYYGLIEPNSRRSFNEMAEEFCQNALNSMASVVYFGRLFK